MKYLNDVSQGHAFEKAKQRSVFMKTRASIRNLILTAILSALVIVMTVVPYTGYITIGGTLEITTLHLVAILAGVLLGWKSGAVVGGVWGITCIARCLLAMPWFQPFGFANVFVAFFPRVLVGAVSGWLFEALKKTRLTRSVSIALSALAGSLTNTVLVLSAMSVYCRINGVEGYENANLMTILQSIVAAIAAVNGILELVAAMVLVPAVYYALEPRELVLGIDMGGSTTKLALVKGKKCLRTMKKEDNETLDEALDRFGLQGVKRIALTGVGACGMEGNLRGIPTTKVEEFKALSRGARKYANVHNALVVSVGTGTSFLLVTPLFSRHIGGTGLGGGMLQGMSRAMCGTDDMQKFYDFASKGDLTRVDLVLQDVSQGTVSNLKPDTTVANFGKLTADTRNEDRALGIYNLVFQSIGVMSAFALKSSLIKKVLIVGTIASFPGVPAILEQVSGLHKVKFTVPENAGFITAIGAAME